MLVTTLPCPTGSLLGTLDVRKQFLAPVEAFITGYFLVGYTARLAAGKTCPHMRHREWFTIIALPFLAHDFFGHLVVEHVFYHHIVGSSVVRRALGAHFQAVPGAEGEAIQRYAVGVNAIVGVFTTVTGKLGIHAC